MNTCGNGNRLTLSKALIKELELDEHIYIVPNIYDNEIILSGVEIGDISSKATLSKDKKFVYSAPIVKMLTELFKLNYSGISSLSFSDITIDLYKDNKVAVVKIEPEKCIPSNEAEVSADE